MEMTTQLSRHFPCGKCVTWKTEKKNIYDIIQPIFITFYQNNSNVSGHQILITDDLENVGQCKNLQKCSERQILLTTIGSQKFQRVSQFRMITAHNHRRCLQKSCCFPLFPGRVENKKCYGSEITQHFQKCFTDYDRCTWALPKM